MSYAEMKHFLPAGKPQTSRRLSLWLNALVVLLTPISLFVVTLMLIEPNPYCNSLRFSEDRIRCVAAPVRDVTGAIVASISVSSAAQYMDDTRLHGLTFDVKTTADTISRELGYDAQVRRAPSQTRAAKRKRVVA